MHFSNFNVTYTIPVCTVQNSWWWTEELPDTCTDLFQKWIWEITASSWFYHKGVSRRTVTWTSNYIGILVRVISILNFHFVFQFLFVFTEDNFIRPSY